jgi:hypothetical protein
VTIWYLAVSLRWRVTTPLAGYVWQSVVLSTFESNDIVCNRHERRTR